MGNWKLRLLRKHNLGKLVIGQFLIVFALWILNPYPVLDVAYWEVDSPFRDLSDIGLDEFKAGTNPLNESENGVLDPTGLDVTRGDLVWGNSTVISQNWSGTDDDLIVVNTTWTYHNASVTDDDYLWLIPIYGYDTPRVPVKRDPWVYIDSVELEPGDYDIWVLYPARDDGKVNYRVEADDLSDVRVIEPEEQITRKYGRDRFYLDCTFTIEKAGEYHVDAYRAALSESYFMAVIPERSLAYPLALAIGWLLILQVVTLKSHEYIKGWNDRKKMKGRHVERYVFPPDVAYFFAMGPEPNWKGPAYFRFPRGTADFFRWEPMGLEFPKGTDRFFDWEPGPG
jgi:hypothetical protein